MIPTEENHEADGYNALGSSLVCGCGWCPRERLAFQDMEGGIRKLEFVANPNFRQRQALNGPGSETRAPSSVQLGNQGGHGAGRRKTCDLPIATLPKPCLQARSSMGTRGYSFFNKRVILRMAQGENMSWNGSVMEVSLDIMTSKRHVSQ